MRIEKIKRPDIRRHAESSVDMFCYLRILAWDKYDTHMQELDRLIAENPSTPALWRLVQAGRAQAYALRVMEVEEIRRTCLDTPFGRIRVRVNRKVYPTILTATVDIAPSWNFDGRNT